MAPGTARLPGAAVAGTPPLATLPTFSAIRMRLRRGRRISSRDLSLPIAYFVAVVSQCFVGAASAISIATRREGCRRTARSRFAELVTPPNFSQARLAHYLPGNSVRFPNRKAAHPMPTGPPSRTLWLPCRKRFRDFGACLLFSMGSRLRGRHECLQRFPSNSPVANSRHTRKQATLHEPIYGLVRNLQIRRDLGDGQSFGPLGCGCDDHSSFQPSRVRPLSLRNSRHGAKEQTCRARGTPRHDTTQRTSPRRAWPRQKGRGAPHNVQRFSLRSYTKQRHRSCCPR